MNVEGKTYRTFIHQFGTTGDPAAIILMSVTPDHRDLRGAANELTQAIQEQRRSKITRSVVIIDISQLDGPPPDFAGSIVGNLDSIMNMALAIRHTAKFWVIVKQDPKNWPQMGTIFVKIVGGKDVQYFNTTSVISQLLAIYPDASSSPITKYLNGEISIDELARNTREVLGK